MNMINRLVERGNKTVLSGIFESLNSLSHLDVPLSGPLHKAASLSGVWMTKANDRVLFVLSDCDSFDDNDAFMKKDFQTIAIKCTSSKMTVLCQKDEFF